MPGVAALVSEENDLSELDETALNAFRWLAEAIARQWKPEEVWGRRCWGCCSESGDSRNGRSRCLKRRGRPRGGPQDPRANVTEGRSLRAEQIVRCSALRSLTAGYRSSHVPPHGHSWWK